MPTRVPSLLDPPVGFADGGARAHEPGHTLDAFRLAVRLGATGLRAEAWSTADGEVVLAGSGTVRVGLRRRPIAELDRSSLPAGTPTLPDLYEACGTAVHVSLDLARPADAPTAVAVARDAGALDRLWLRHGDAEVVAGWRPLGDDVRLVVATRLRELRKAGLERRASSLADAGVDAVDLPFDDWSSGLTTLLHRFGTLAVGSQAQHRRQLDALLVMGADAVVSDHVDRMVDALAAQV